MIQREDMLELTRRMTPARSSISRIAGAYYDEEGYIDGTFNTHFLKLSETERKKNLELAKTVLLSETNAQLKDYKISEAVRKPGSIWKLLDGILQSELKMMHFWTRFTIWLENNLNHQSLWPAICILDSMIFQ